jgi:uncharacterized RDD family membrane protein YckC
MSFNFIISRRSVKFCKLISLIENGFERTRINLTTMEKKVQSPEREPLAKPAIRYVACGLDYITIMGFTEMLYLVSHKNSWVVVFFSIFWFVYFPWIESFRGQTLWKFIFRLKVLRSDYEKANLFDTFIKHLFDIIDFLPLYGLLGIIVASRSKLSQRIGDILARTIVVRIQ